jgi:hypothetical protein
VNWPTATPPRRSVIPAHSQPAWSPPSSQTLQLIGFAILPLLLLLFPDGRLPSRRWKPVAWAAVVCPVLMWPLLLFTPGLMVDRVPASQNPLGLQALHGLDLVGPLFGAWYLVLLLALVFLLLRFRRARGEQRQQLLWVMFRRRAVPDQLYGLLTALLAAVYAGLVLVLGQVFGGVAKDPPSWVVAGATLAVTALFQPARRRIQAVVDRRFNRRKFNTSKTVEGIQRPPAR